MRGEMTYAEYKFYYDWQRVWTWITVPGLLLLAFLSALEWSHKIALGPTNELFPWWGVIFWGFVIISALFIYSSAGMSIFKWFFFIIGCGVLFGIILNLILSIQFDEWFSGGFEVKRGDTLLLYFGCWIGYSLCAISQVKLMASSKGQLVDGDDDPFVQAMKEGLNEQKK